MHRGCTASQRVAGSFVNLKGVDGTTMGGSSLTLLVLLSYKVTKPGAPKAEGCKPRLARYAPGL